MNIDKLIKDLGKFQAFGFSNVSIACLTDDSGYLNDSFSFNDNNGNLQITIDFRSDFIDPSAPCTQFKPIDNYVVYEDKKRNLTIEKEIVLVSNDHAEKQLVSFVVCDPVCYDNLDSYDTLEQAINAINNGDFDRKGE